MADIGVDGAAEIDPPALGPHLVAPRQPRAHHAGEAGGDGMGAGDVVGVGEFAEIGPVERLDRRGALHAAVAPSSVSVSPDAGT